MVEPTGSLPSSEIAERMANTGSAGQQQHRAADDHRGHRVTLDQRAPSDGRGSRGSS